MERDNPVRKAAIPFVGEPCWNFPFVKQNYADRFSHIGSFPSSIFNNSTGTKTMGKRDDLIVQYADDLKNKCGMEPDMDLLTKVTIGCGPAIYNADASTVASSQESELETVKENFLVKKLGLADGPELMAGINTVVEIYGKSERNKYRAVVYYMLTKHFGKESVYG